MLKQSKSNALLLTCVLVITNLSATPVLAEDPDVTEDPHEPTKPAAMEATEEASVDDLVRDLVLRLPTVASWVIR